MKGTKCLIYLEAGNPVFELHEKKPPGKGEVGIEILASSLCNTSEMRSFTGGYDKGYGASYPMLPGEPGHEAVGIVVSLGNDVRGLKINDPVVMTGHGGDPCHCSYVVRKEEDIAFIEPGERNPEDAAMLEMYGCAYHCAMAPGGENFYIGKKVLVIGMGSMGLCSVQILKESKGIRITVSDISERRLETALKCGADRAVRPQELTDDEKFDVIVECSGSVPGQELAFRLAPPVLIFSSYNTKEIKIRQNLLFDSNTTIYNPGIVSSENFRRAVVMYNEGRLDPSLLVTDRISADTDEYLSAIEDIKQGKTIKTLMIWR